jgi:hypothetical protein
VAGVALTTGGSAQPPAAAPEAAQPSQAKPGAISGDPGVLADKVRGAKAGNLSTQAELRAAKLLKQEGKKVHFLAETKITKTPDFSSDGVATDVKRIAGLGSNAAKDLAKGVQQVGPGGQVIVVRPATAAQTLESYQSFTSGFVPRQPGVTFRVVDEADLPPLNY